jgi:hypothetical protein
VSVKIENPTVEIEGQFYTGIIATVTESKLYREDHGILTAHVALEWNSGGIGFGGYCLDGPNFDPMQSREVLFTDKTWSHEKRRAATRYTGEFVLALVEVLGSIGSKAPRQQVFALFNHGSSGWGDSAKGIASLDGSRYFLPEILSARARDEGWGN